jgi:hypothetical protein
LPDSFIIVGSQSEGSYRYNPDEDDWTDLGYIALRCSPVALLVKREMFADNKPNGMKLRSMSGDLFGPNMYWR